jgi:spermidine synthase
LVADRQRPGAWFVRIGGTDQSFVDPADPTWLEFDYVQRIAAVIDQVAPAGQRLRVVHVGGAGLTLPRYVAATRPTSAQIVFEPDAGLTAAVRRVAPLPRRCGIKVRPLDGRTGLAALADGSYDLVIVDAFDGASVPGELTTVEWFTDVARVLAADGTCVMNLTDHSPFGWSRRVVAAVATIWRRPGVVLTLAAEAATLKGRRFGNLIVAVGSRLDPVGLATEAARATFSYRLLAGAELIGWLGGARPFSETDREPSPPPPNGPLTFR